MQALDTERARQWANQVTRVECTALDIECWIRPISARRMLAWSDMDNATASAELVAASVCSAEGEHLAPDVEDVLNWPSALFQAICQAALALNGLSESGEERMGN